MGTKSLKMSGEALCFDLALFKYWNKYDNGT